MLCCGNILRRKILWLRNKAVIDNQRRKNETEGGQRKIFCRGKVIAKGERNQNGLVEYVDQEIGDYVSFCVWYSSC